MKNITQEEVKNIEIRELPKQFEGKGEVRGYTFTQIKCADWGFIYEVEHDGHRHYEVFKKRLNHRFATVSYPRSKSFGKWAWTCRTLDKAKSKLLELQTNRAMKELEKA